VLTHKDLTLTMIKILSSVILIAITCFTNVANANPITVDNSYVREVIPGNNVTSAYMAINNGSDKDIMLVGATSDISPRVEIHAHAMEDGMMKMRQLASLNVSAKQSVFLQPMGFHLMMFEIDKPVKAGEIVTITLLFNDGSEVKLNAPVRSIKQKQHHHH
jgi:periplasmic copper chaperone A